MTTPVPAWDKKTRECLNVNDLCGLFDDYADDPNPPWPYMASGPSLSICSIAACSAPNTWTINDPFGTVIITPHGPVLRMEAHICQGEMPASGCWIAETVYGPREALEAIGATNIVKAPY